MSTAADSRKKKLRGNVGKAIVDYAMIEEGDKVMAESLASLTKIVRLILSFPNTSVFVVGGSDELTKAIVEVDRSSKIAILD